MLGSCVLSYHLPRSGSLSHGGEWDAEKVATIDIKAQVPSTWAKRCMLNDSACVVRLFKTFINIISFLIFLDNSKPENFCKPRGPQHTYYYIGIITVAGKNMHEGEIKYTER